MGREGQFALHGTPHTFLNFDLQHAGQGEGASDYGFGLYVTSSLEVARTYAGLDSGGFVPALYRVHGVRTRRGAPEQKAADLVHQMGKARAFAFAKSMLNDAVSGEEYTHEKGLGYYQSIVEVVQSISKKSDVSKCVGHVLQVRIPERDVMLDWDLSVSEQSSVVRDALSDLFCAGESGERLYRRLTSEAGSQKEASALLHGRGVKGVMYRSRTSNVVLNHVVFSDRDVDIDWGVPDLQVRLRDAENEMGAMNRLGIRQEDSRYVEARRFAAFCRDKLFGLTGDYYGRPKRSVVAPSHDALTASYEFPWLVPADVLQWERRRSSIYADATDAQRWARIAWTENDARFPSGDLVVFRAVGAGEEAGDQIRPGDWVTPDESYAREHLERSLGGCGRVLSMVVDGRDVLVSPTGDFQEAIYAPLEFSGDPHCEPAQDGERSDADCGG